MIFSEIPKTGFEGFEAAMKIVLDKKKADIDVIELSAEDVVAEKEVTGKS